MHIQGLIERHPDLIPGEQFDPSEPRRWIVLAREVVIPDPDKQTNSWSLDILMADQDGVPALVECKLASNAESRREIIGQILEYAANSQYYWPLPEWRSKLLEKVRLFAPDGRSFEERLRALIGPEETADSYLDRFFQNLEASNFRLVLAVDIASGRLKSTVEFANRQLSTIDLFLVELRHSKRDAVDEYFLAPQVFGYQEEVRVRKQAVIEHAGAAPLAQWTEETFFNVLAARLGDALANRARRLVDSVVGERIQLRYGVGRKVGSLGFEVRGITKNLFAVLYTDGTLWLKFGWLKTPDATHRFQEMTRQALPEIIAARGGEVLTELSLCHEAWSRHGDAVVRLLKDVAEDAVRLGEQHA